MANRSGESRLTWAQLCHSPGLAHEHTYEITFYPIGLGVGFTAQQTPWKVDHEMNEVLTGGPSDIAVPDKRNRQFVNRDSLPPPGRSRRGGRGTQ